MLAKTKKSKIFLTFIFIFLSFFLRLYISNLGFNFDYGCWKIVGSVVAQGKNVYQATERYSYGPVWALILGFFRYLSLFFYNDWLIFRYLIIFCLFLADLAIGLWLYQYFGRLAFFWFLSNPISIYISGFHNQFDNLAIAVGLISLSLIEKYRSKIKGYFLLGLSLAIKHIFLFFPFWLLIKAKNKKERILSFFPLLIFIVSFLPFLTSNQAIEGIFKNVISIKRDLLYSFLPDNFLITPIIFLIFIIPFGFLFKKEKIHRLGLFYLILFSSTLINSGRQYLAIPLVSLAVFPFFGLVYTFFGLQNIIFNNISLNLSLITAFQSLWLVIISNFLKNKKIIKLIKFFSFLILVFGLIYCSIFLKKTKEILIEEKKNIWIVKKLYSSESFFKPSKNQVKKPFNQNNLVKGEFYGDYPNLGYLTIPFLIDNAPFDFLSRGYKIKFQIKEKQSNKIIHQEVRELGSAIVEEGVLFGFPLIKESKGKNYQIIISTNIPSNINYCSFDLTKDVQIKYFLSKEHLTKPYEIFNFIFDKTKLFFFNNLIIDSFFKLYSYFWIVIFLIILAKPRVKKRLIF